MNSLPKCAHPRKGENELFSKKCFIDSKGRQLDAKRQYILMQIKLELELESGVGGGAKVRANGYGVFAEEELSDAANAIQELRLAAERKSERMDTAYSPRFREEELPDAAN